MNILPLTQIATYWAPASVDGNGDIAWLAGVAVPCRWAHKDGIVTDENGDNQKAEYAVYTTTLIPKRSRLVLSDMDGVATPPADARKVLANVSNPSLTGLVKVLA